VAVWKVCAGRAAVYLLDTDLLNNTPWNRELSSRKFAEDSDARVRQSVLLGAGAVRALFRLGIEPARGTWRRARPRWLRSSG
jgi:starch phosphorylase